MRSRSPKGTNLTLHLSKYKITYISVPKVACSSLKRFFFEIDNGFAFRVFRTNGKRYGVHQFAVSKALVDIPPITMADHVRIAAVRDPWRRILSCYVSKVAAEKAGLNKVKFTPEQKKLGMVATPSIDNFVDLLPHYQAVSGPIRSHSRPLSYYLGHDPAFFDRLFPMSRLSEMVDYVADRIGNVPALPHNNKSSKTDLDIPQAALDRNKQKIEDIYTEDLDIFGAYM